MRGSFDCHRIYVAGLLVMSICLSAGCVKARAETSDTKSPRESSSAEAIRRALESKTEMEFVETPLTDVIDFIKARHDIEIQMDIHALTDANVGLDTPITRHLKGITLRSALHIILRDQDMKYLIQDEVLMVTMKDIADSIFETKVYPVRDLLPKNLQADGGGVGDYDALVSAVASTDPEATREGRRQGSIKPVPGVAALVVTETQETHEKIEELLAALRKAREQFKQ